MNNTLKCFILALFLLKMTSSQAQYATIPDPVFADWLTSHYPDIMNGNQMDTTHTQIGFILDLQLVDLGISDLTGIQYLDSLRTLACYTLPVTELPRLPAGLRYLACCYTQISALPELPEGLWDILCHNNYLTSLPDLPQVISTLACHDNQLTGLPPLPNGMVDLRCHNNQISSLPQILPSNLQFLSCGNNGLSVIPALPPRMVALSCSDNQLTELPDLPDSLVGLQCMNNLLTELPEFPELYFNNLMCSGNQLTSLPNLPENMYGLYCQDNAITCFPHFPIGMTYISISDNPATCLPNYVNAMSDTALSMPLCAPNDLVNNPNNCAGPSITGTLYGDADINCAQSTGETRLSNVPVKLYDGAVLIEQTQTLFNGHYSFSSSNGTFTVKVDTAGSLITPSCANPGMESTFTIGQGQQINSLNFGFVCRDGFDLGVQSVVNMGLAFPGQVHELRVMAGDLSQWYGMDCAGQTGGTVHVSVSGPVTFSDIPSGALTPVVSGTDFTYTVTDFSALDLEEAFRIRLLTDPAAQSGDLIVVTVNITSAVAGEANAANNTQQYAYACVNSYDPNMKEVFPTIVEPGYSDYLMYTVHFQNLGDAPAYNIRVLDTLSDNLDLTTFQVVNYSHANSFTLDNHLLNVRFPNIMLADSASDPEGSKGFVQYRIKPKANLPAGTVITNTAHIYFDFNPAVVTNTSVNEFREDASVPEYETVHYAVFPNPMSGTITISSQQPDAWLELTVLDVAGSKVYEMQRETENGRVSLELDLKAGIYMLQVKNEAGQEARYRFVSE